APDLVTFLEAYERDLADRSFCDWSGVLQLAVAAIGAPDRHRLVCLPTLLFDVPIPNEAELVFITALTGTTPTALATAPTSDVATIGRFRDRMGFKVEDLDKVPVTGERASASIGALARLQRYLFNERDKPPEAKAGDEIEVFSAPGEGRECVEIVRRVI